LWKLLLEKKHFVLQWHKIYFVSINNIMDEKNARDNRDRHQVAGGEEYEVNYLAQKLNVSAEDVRKAIEQVGNNREKLEEHLRKGSR
jgi:hypothetical protein